MSVEVIRFSEKMQKRGWEISIFRFQANFPEVLDVYLYYLTSINKRKDME